MSFHSLLQVLLLIQLCQPAFAAKPVIHRLSEAESQAGVAGARRKLQSYGPYHYNPYSSPYGAYNPYSNPYYNFYSSNYDDSYPGFYGSGASGYYGSDFYYGMNEHRFYDDMNLDDTFNLDFYSAYGGPYSPPSSYSRRQLENESTGEEASSTSEQNPAKMQKGVLRPQQMMPMPYLLPQQYYSPPPPPYYANYYGYPMPRPFPRPMQYLHRPPMTGHRFPENSGRPTPSESDSSVENEHEGVDQMEDEQMDVSMEDYREESQE